MKRLFTASLKRILANLDIHSTKSLANLSQELNAAILKHYNHDIPYSKLSRLPSSEVKTMLKVPCPIEDPAAKQTNRYQSLAIFKRLRYNFNVEQQSVCFKCYRKCPLRDVKFKQLPTKPLTSNKSALHDLLFYLIELERAEEEDYSSLRWSAAYKTSSALEIVLRDYKILSQESLLYRQVFKAFNQQEEQILKRNKRGEVRQAQEIQSKLKERRIKIQKSPYQ